MDWQTVFSGVVACAAIVAALGVIVGAFQLRLTKQQAQTDFEDDLAREYRSIVKDLPPHAFFNREPELLEQDEINAFFRYFDLSNEQLWLTEQERVRERTAGDWKDGMSANIRLPAFARAWDEITPNLDAEYWKRLRALVATARDPA